MKNLPQRSAVWCIMGIALLLPVSSFPLPTFVRELREAPVSMRVVKVAEQSLDSLPGNMRIGVIEGIAVDADLNIYLLDSRLARVSVFQRRGSSIQFSARTSDEGAQLSVPRGIQVAGPGQLLVFDVAAQDVARFTLDGSTLDRVGATHLSMFGDDFCTMRTRMYVYGLRNGAILHAFDSTGRTVRDFGVPFGSGSALMIKSLAPAKMLCIPQRDMIIVANEALPEIRAYTGDGRLLWSVTLPGLHPTLVRQNPDGSITFSVPPGGWDEVASIAPLPRGVFAVQLGHLAKGRSPRDSFTSIQTRFLLLGNGKEVGRQSDIPKIGAIADSLLFAATNYPRPDLAVYRFKLTGPK